MEDISRSLQVTSAGLGLLEDVDIYAGYIILLTRRTSIVLISLGYLDIGQVDAF